MSFPSFHAIYRHGRLGRSAEAGSEGRINQIERFSVAALGFVLQYDTEFRRNFLRQICECDADPNFFQIDVEVFGCGDLVLQEKAGGRTFAIEFKIEAPLQADNQSSSNPEFFISGYGANILAKYGALSTYIVIQNERCDFNSINEKKPECLSKTWNDVSRCPVSSSIVRDLFESFATLNISAFIYMNTKNLTIGSAALKTAQMYQLLKAVAEKVGFKKPKIEHSLKVGAEGAYFGLELANSPKKWKEIVEPNKFIGWFGYDDNFNAEGQTLIVWFYCGTSEARAKISAVITEHFSDVEIKTEDEGSIKHILLVLPAYKSTDDQEWFTSIFNTLVP